MRVVQSHEENHRQGMSWLVPRIRIILRQDGKGQEHQRHQDDGEDREDGLRCEDGRALDAQLLTYKTKLKLEEEIGGCGNLELRI